ncbi:MAG: isoaspartyl peptidase/L-asparaginase, partial [Nanoarchaeota archaeon]|nr:isoaspartyl peptidase/L-asparaginase [Nanoarchaeota archaeon]
DGATLNAGAIAAVEQVRHPITLARFVMDDTEHVMIIGEGAEKIAREKGLEHEAVQWFVVEREYEGWRNNLQPYGEASSLGTVGCVARDSHGDLAVATSTGGTANQLPGRVGDSPLIGSGGFADNQSAAVSATGWGESLMRVVMSKTTCDFVKNGMIAQKAADAAIQILKTKVVSDL